MAKKKPDLVYVEPDDYFPEDLFKKHFPEVFEDDKESTTKKSASNKSKDKKK